MALFVLGAGATRGCSFVDATRHSCVPPLDRDFFTQLQRIRNPKHQPLISAVLKDVVNLFGTNFEATLESVFTTVEHTRRMIELTGETRDFRKAELREISRRLRQAIAAVLEESICAPDDRGRGTTAPQECDHHARLVADILARGDTVLSFNYDCVLDHALQAHGAGKWNPHHGYGFHLGPRGRLLSGEEHWCVDGGGSVGAAETVRLLKLHGSLHFQIADEDSARSAVALKKYPYTRRAGSMRFSIIPPEWHKRFDQGVFGHLWKLASDAIYDARQVVFIGYSLPVTDLHSTALFRTSVKKGRIESLVVVNPDREARRRTRTVLSRGLAEGARVLSFDSLAEFVAASRDLWHH